MNHSQQPKKCCGGHCHSRPTEEPIIEETSHINAAEALVEEGEDAAELQSAPVQSEAEILQQTLAEYKDKNLRLLAEMDNSRKRQAKEFQEVGRLAVERLAQELITPLDQFESALQFADQMSDEVKNWALGFNMVLTQFKNILEDHGITPFEAVGKPFDAQLHDSVDIIETNEHPEGSVVKQYSRGYKMNQRVIRPARVQVAKAPQNN